MVVVDGVVEVVVEVEVEVVVEVEEVVGRSVVVRSTVGTWVVCIQ